MAHQPKVLRFNHNWNNKLCCRFFTTLRLWNPDKYVLNMAFQVYLGQEYLGIAELKGARKTKSANLNAFVCGIDTGYSVAETQKILNRMYKGKEDTKGLGLYLFRWVKQEPDTSVNTKHLQKQLDL